MKMLIKARVVDKTVSATFVPACSPPNCMKRKGKMSKKVTSLKLSII